jgi:hypothetical protein
MALATQALSALPVHPFRPDLSRPSRFLTRPRLLTRDRYPSRREGHTPAPPSSVSIGRGRPPFDWGMAKGTRLERSPGAGLSPGMSGGLRTAGPVSGLVPAKEKTP